MSDTRTSTDPDGVEDLQVVTTVDGDVTRVAVRGELDFSMLDRLDVALAGISLEGTRFLHLDVARLVFADTAAVRRLAEFTAAATQTGHEARTSGANRTFCKVAAVLHVQDDLGLT